MPRKADVSLTSWEISGLQAAWLVAGAVSMAGHALAVTFWIQIAGRDAWLTGIVALPAAILAVAAQVSLSRRYPGQTIAEYLPKVLGYFGHLVAVLFAIYFLTALTFTLRRTTDWIIDSLLPETPAWVLGGFFMATVAYAALGGLDVLARINQFTLPLLTFLGIFVSVSSAHAKDYGLLLPILEHGWGPLGAASLLAMGYYGEASVLAMFSGYVRKGDRKRLGRNYMYALLFLANTFTGPVAGSMATLGYRVAQNMPYPTFQHWLMVSFPRFFERTDLLAVHQWLAGGYVRSALFLLLGTQALGQATRLRVPLRWGVPAVAFATTLIAQLAWPTKMDFDAFIRNVYLPAGAVVGILLPVLIWAVDSIRRLLRTDSRKQHGA